MMCAVSGCSDAPVYDIPSILCASHWERWVAKARETPKDLTKRNKPQRPEYLCEVSYESRVDRIVLRLTFDPFWDLNDAKVRGLCDQIDSLVSEWQRLP